MSFHHSTSTTLSPVCWTARSLYVPRIAALINDAEKAAVFSVLGLDDTLSLAELLGRLIEERTAADALQGS